MTAPTATIDGPTHLVEPPAPDIPASIISTPTPAPGMGSIRPQPDVTTSLGGPQHQVQPVPQRGAVQPQQQQQAVAPQAVAARVVVNHVVPEPEPESAEENVEVPSDEKEEEEEEEVVEFEEPEKQAQQPLPQQPQQQAEPAGKKLKCMGRVLWRGGGGTVGYFN